MSYYLSIDLNNESIKNHIGEQFIYKTYSNLFVLIHTILKNEPTRNMSTSRFEQRFNALQCNKYPIWKLMTPWSDDHSFSNIHFVIYED